MDRDFRFEFEDRGFAVVGERLPLEQVEELRREADQVLSRSRARGGARNLLGRSPRLAREGETGIPAALARRVLGAGAQVTKLTLFNKTPDANWLIRWHQDTAISVRERIDAPGFSGWSEKEGVLHVQPPAEVLQRVLALRLHLDDTPADNGALRVLPGSHRFGRLERDEIQRVRSRVDEVVCEVPCGGMMLMSPLLLHASAKASSPRERRVLHFEFSAEPLPAGLQWA